MVEMVRLIYTRNFGSGYLGYLPKLKSFLATMMNLAANPDDETIFGST